MLQLQNALLDLIKMSVQELKRLNPMVSYQKLFNSEKSFSMLKHKFISVGH